MNGASGVNGPSRPSGSGGPGLRLARLAARRGVGAVLLVAVLLAAALMVASGNPGPTASAPPSATAAPPSGTKAPPASGAAATATGSTGVPAFSHVYVIIMENQEYSSVIGNPAAPYINGLVSKYGLLTRFYAETHPSQPNHLALFSGSTQGVTDDANHDLSSTNLVDQLVATGRTWRVFAQNVPLGCFTGGGATGGPDGSGEYARKHEPAISFTDISGNPARCGNITDFSHFDPGAADFALITPNTCNDMHSCPVATGDRFLSGFVPKIIDSPSFANSVLFITWDEGASNENGGGHIPTLVISPLVKSGTTDNVQRNHYSILRTIEDGWGLGCLDHSCGAANLASMFAP